MLAEPVLQLHVDRIVQARPLVGAQLVALLAGEHGGQHVELDAPTLARPVDPIPEVEVDLGLGELLERPRSRARVHPQQQVRRGRGGVQQRLEGRVVREGALLAREAVDDLPEHALVVGDDAAPLVVDEARDHPGARDEGRPELARVHARLLVAVVAGVPGHAALEAELVGVAPDGVADGVDRVDPRVAAQPGHEREGEHRPTVGLGAHLLAGRLAQGPDRAVVVLPHDQQQAIVGRLADLADEGVQGGPTPRGAEHVLEVLAQRGLQRGEGLAEQVRDRPVEVREHGRVLGGHARHALQDLVVLEALLPVDPLLERRDLLRREGAGEVHGEAAVEADDASRVLARRRLDQARQEGLGEARRLGVRPRIGKLERLEGGPQVGEQLDLVLVGSHGRHDRTLVGGRQSQRVLAGGLGQGERLVHEGRGGPHDHDVLHAPEEELAREGATREAQPAGLERLHLDTLRGEVEAGQQADGELAEEVDPSVDGPVRAGRALALEVPRDRHLATAEETQGVHVDRRLGQGLLQLREGLGDAGLAQQTLLLGGAVEGPPGRGVGHRRQHLGLGERGEPVLQLGLGDVDVDGPRNQGRDPVLPAALGGAEQERREREVAEHEDQPQHDAGDLQEALALAHGCSPRCSRPWRRGRGGRPRVRDRGSGTRGGAASFQRIAGTSPGPSTRLEGPWQDPPP